ncbi:MAG: hypothetical protein LPL29_13410 [Alphaproteobacteria bacterium]|nr:hypothetical protein [Alphaproteobacteria bacterium]
MATNAQRAAWAESALFGFAGLTNMNLFEPEEFQDAVADLIADLLHLARMRGLDVDKVIVEARTYYDIESKHADHEDI